MPRGKPYWSEMEYRNPCHISTLMYVESMSPPDQPTAIHRRMGPNTASESTSATRPDSDASTSARLRSKA